MTAVIRMYVLAGVVLLSVKVLVITTSSPVGDVSRAEGLGTKVSELLDEALRYKSEREEEHGQVPEMAAALSRMAVRTIRWLKHVAGAASRRVGFAVNSRASTGRTGSSMGLAGFWQLNDEYCQKPGHVQAAQPTLV